MDSDGLGTLGEVRAEQYLVEQGCRILARNAAFPGAEIDLIAQDGRVIVFVEVKLRKSAAFAEALEFVDRHKQERIRRTAELYLCEHPEQTKQPRFDVIEVYAPNGTQTKRPEIRHLEDAFS